MDNKILAFKHEHLVNSGNAAIFTALFMAKQLGKEKVLIPKDGGWYSYKNYPKILGMEIIEINTDYALIDLNDLKNKIDDKSVILYSVIGGYFAKEPTKEIKKIANENNALVIGDITAGFGNKTFMASKLYDFIVASFGEHKPLNLGYGGIIASDNKIDESILSLFKFPESMKEELYQKLQELPKRLTHLKEKRNEIIKLLKDFNIIGKDGICILLKGIDESAIKILKQNKIPFLLCPKYHITKKKAVYIEIKML